MSFQLSKERFWRAIAILISNFSGVNKNISCLKIINFFEVKDRTDLICGCQELSEALEMIDRYKDNFLLLEGFDIFAELTKSNTCYNKLVSLAKVVRKRCANSGHALLLLGNQIIAEPLKNNNQNNKIELNWCHSVLQPKLIKWATIDNTIHTRRIQSLHLVEIEEYNLTYESLKRKYSKQLIETWPECTNSVKYVHEDIAIASYLILLWRKMKEPKGFVDLGCGNGLLVYILNSEGYNGHGIDVRRRKIWDLYPSYVSLSDKVIVPSDLPTYANVDWILGNHSDELSPWIPIIAALNSYDTKYFLLPCCGHELNGDKYLRRNCKMSIYNDFLQFIEEISIKCGFKTKTDRLKIPSTKRIAYIGFERTYAESEYNSEKNNIRNFLKSKLENKKLKLRAVKESVRNCTQIEKSVLDRIVLSIFTFLLNIKKVPQDNLLPWRRGGSASIKVIADCVSSEELKQIKSEYGGLKTLLKNKHEIFEISGDEVKLRYPRKISEYPKKNNITIKKRNCFYYNNHPDGCPLSNDNCSFLH